MKKKKLSIQELSDEEILKAEQSYRGIAIVTVVTILIMTGLAIFITIKKGFGYFTVMPVIFLPIFMNNLRMWNQYKSEVKIRNARK